MTAPVDNGAAPRKRHIVVVGHSARDEVFGAERSLLDLPAAVDRRIYELSCVLPRANEQYVKAVQGFRQRPAVSPGRHSTGLKWLRPRKL